MFPNIIFLTVVLLTFDGVFGLNLHHLRAVESLEEGTVVGYSLPHGLTKRQSGCPIGLTQCAQDVDGVYCAPVCCFEGGAFAYGCDIGYYCSGRGAEAGCCRVGRICVGGPPPCVDNGEPAPSPTSACPADQPVCTTNVRGAPICSGTVTGPGSRSFQITGTSTRTTITTTSGTETETETTEEPETTTTEEPETTTTEEPEPTTTDETTTIEETTTFTTTSEIPEETTTTTEEPSSTEFETTEVPTVTSYPTASSNVTLTQPPPATSNSGRNSAVNLIIALMSVAITFFMF
ncbi:hypothetical protein TWF718_007094 [Orbilia javanica]|uniref:Uncharacterized protein n=1 Tax=Orbilia javanica TaxID=47235 RepID=A0AAN8MZI2_9PEZI